MNRKQKKFYFTYGLDENQPFQGGWTLVIADDRRKAQIAFAAYHPLVDGVIPCASVYDEEEFVHTSMYHNGNFGRRLQEVISLDSLYKGEFQYEKENC